jgi:hypothetical protein
MTSDWMMSLIKTMRADMDSDKLLPPGDVYIMVRSHVSSLLARSPTDQQEYHDVFVTIDGTGNDLELGGKTISHKQAHRAVC